MVKDRIRERVKKSKLTEKGYQALKPTRDKNDKKKKKRMVWAFSERVGCSVCVCVFP